MRAAAGARPRVTGSGVSPAQSTAGGRTEPLRAESHFGFMGLFFPDKGGPQLLSDMGTESGWVV
eukprot:426589-Hanusia_phi.AAC.1